MALKTRRRRRRRSSMNQNTHDRRSVHALSGHCCQPRRLLLCFAAPRFSASTRIIIIYQSPRRLTIIRAAKVRAFTGQNGPRGGITSGGSRATRGPRPSSAGPGGARRCRRVYRRFPDGGLSPVAPRTSSTSDGRTPAQSVSRSAHTTAMLFLLSRTSDSPSQSI